MEKQVVFTEDEYEEIEKTLEDYSRIKKELNELKNEKVMDEHFENLVKKMFIDKGEFRYRETGAYYPNHLFLNVEVVAALFNMFFEESFFEESFFEETGLKVDKYWKIG